MIFVVRSSFDGRIIVEHKSFGHIAKEIVDLLIADIFHVEVQEEFFIILQWRMTLGLG